MAPNSEEASSAPAGPPGACCRALCCLPCARSGVAPNKVLPVILAPTDCDYLEIRPDRRIRVVHLLGQSPAAPHVPDGPGGLRRLATTISRNEDVGGIARRDDQTESQDSPETDDDEDYWFENAAPRRMAIEPTEAPKHSQRRIFNKFEPQKPPNIEGIKPPKASLARRDVLDSVGDSVKASPTTSPSSTAGNTRLPRKVILPAAAHMDPDDDEDLVRDLPGEQEDKGENDAELDEDPSIPSPSSPVIEDNFVANVLADMSDLVLNITADATDGSKTATSVPSGDPATAGNRADASSPTPDGKVVHSLPDPEDQMGTVVGSGNVVLPGGNLGGVANVAFVGEEEEEISHIRVHPTNETHKRESQDDGSDETDAGYARNRDMSELLLANEQDQEGIEETLEGSKSDPIPMKVIPSNQDIPQHSNPSQESSSATQVCSVASLPCLFFIHGVGGSASTWSSQLSYFVSRGYEVIAPDLLGHGFSSAPDNPRSYTFAKLFRDLVVIFDHYVRTERSCCIVAHSYGTSFAAALARSRSNVTSLLLLASGGPTPLAPPPVIKTIPSAFIAACLKPFLRCGFRRGQRQGNGSTAAAAGVRGKAMRFEEAFDVPAYVFKHIMAGQHWPEGDSSFYRRISVPTLLIYGLKDPFVSLVEMCEMERTIPRAFLELLPLSGHMMMLEQPKELNVMMRKFVEKYNTASTARLSLEKNPTAAASAHYFRK